MDSEQVTRNPNTDPAGFSRVNEEFLNLMHKQGITNIGNSEDSILATDYMLSQPPSDEESIQNEILWVGSFIGETLIRLFGGKWAWDERQERWVVLIRSKNDETISLNVFRKVENRIRKGMEDSIEYWYQNIKEMITSGTEDYLKKIKGE